MSDVLIYPSFLIYQGKKADTGQMSGHVRFSGSAMSEGYFGPPMNGFDAKPKKKKGPTPEGAFQKAAMAYLRACRIGEVVRVNTGMAWMGGDGRKWGAKGRPVKFGEPGHSDLVVRPLDSLRQIFVECKAPGWKPLQEPKETAAASTWEKWRAHRLQVDFLEARRKQGHVAMFAQSLADIHRELVAAGFANLPDPTTYKQGKR